MHRTMTGRGSSRRAPALMAGLTASWVASLVAAMLAGAAQAAPAAPAPVSSDQAIARTLAAKPASGWASVILKTKAPLTPAQEARLGALGADITCRLPLIGSVAVRIPARSLSAVTALPFVTHLSSDGLVKKSDDFTVGSSEASQATARDSAGHSYQPTGQGVTVAVIDSGMASSQDLSLPQYDKDHGFNLTTPTSRILASVNFVADVSKDQQGTVGIALGILSGGDGKAPLLGLPLGGDWKQNNLYDPCGHGTHIAGIIAGNGAKSHGNHYFRTFGGIAPQSNLVNVRVLDQNGTTSVSTVITGLQWVVANKDQYNIRVVNLSLGHPVGESYRTDPLCQAVEAAWKAGIVVVCAAGNGGRGSTINDPAQGNEGWGTAYGSIQSPGNDPYIITVGATKNMDGVRADDRIATYSSRGPSRLDLVLKPDIIAPGNKIISLDAHSSMLETYAGGTNTIAQSSYMQGKPDPSHVSRDYFQLSGTSMAAPVVAGAAALLLQADPTLTPDTVKARLMLSADKWAAPDGLGDALTYGAGYLNVPAALASTARAALPALSPTLVANPNGTLSLVMDRAAWGSTALAGSRAAWGCGLWGTGITDLRAAWGCSVRADRAAWGSNSMAADRAAWGSSVWGDRAAWGSSTSAVDLTSTAVTGE